MLRSNHSQEYNPIASILFWIVTKIFCLHLILESLLEYIVRVAYLPFVTNDPRKIAEDIQKISKKPCDQVTIAVEVRASKQRDLVRIAEKIVRYAGIVEEAASPKNIHCFLLMSELTEAEKTEFRGIVERIKPQSSRLSIQQEGHVAYDRKIVNEKSKQTPLVICFTAYPSINCVPPALLVGAEISFQQPILRTVEYDLYTSFQKYAASQQRKGK